jgi:hypothetical protein
VSGVVVNPPALKRWGSPIELEVRRRIIISVATYGYEIADKPIFDDHTWDRMAQQVQPRMGTCHPMLDEFFVVHFSPMTGMWIHAHPELEKIQRKYEHYYNVMRAHFEKGGVRI